MKKVWLLLLGMVITLSGCSTKPDYELSCTLTGNGKSTEILYTYTDDELLNILVGGEVYTDLETDKVLFESRGRDAYITMQILANEGSHEIDGVTFNGVCVELELK
jgi:hypothetical protein